MSRFEVNPGRGHRIGAIVVAIIGTGSLVFSHKASGHVLGAALLLSAWDLAFLPTLPLNLTLGEIYQKARQGWRMSRTAKAINFITMALFALAIFLQFRGH